MRFCKKEVIDKQLALFQRLVCVLACFCHCNKMSEAVLAPKFNDRVPVSVWLW
jgi:hypothetical protein